MRALRRGALLGVILVASCTEDGREGPSAEDPASPRDAAAPRETEGCQSNAECSDEYDCTVDACTAGNVCTHTPVPAMCEDGQTCTMAEGCIEGCDQDADCDDGLFCNGTEWCLGTRCQAGAPPDCDDGNPCTIDGCEETADGCTYETMCDAGIPLDGGSPDAFDPARDYVGNFVVAPSPSLGCSSASYSFSTVTFTTSGDTLRIQAGTLLLEESPIPTTSHFEVRTDRPGCASYSLQGTFENSDRFVGVFTATMETGSFCASCGDRTHSLTGVRAE